jgi:hypothetical protein
MMEQDCIAGSSVGNQRSSLVEVGSPRVKKMAGSLEEAVYHIKDVVTRIPIAPNEELVEVFQRLKDDGIAEGAPLHSHATILFTEQINWKQFLLLDTAEGTKYWIRRHYEVYAKKLGLS